MKMWKKALVLFTAGIMLSASLAGCKPGEPGNTSGGTDDNGQETKLVIWGNETDEVLYSAIAAYEDAHPNVRIVVETQGETTLDMAISAGTAPDIIRTASDYVATYGTKGYVADLTQYGANDIKPLFTETTWNVANSIKDKVYSLPFDSNIINFIVNKDILDAAGASIPTNYDEFLETGNKIKAKYGVNSDTYAYTAACFDTLGAGLYKAWGTFHFYWWLWRMGGDIFTEDMSDTRINDKVAVETLQMLLDLKNNGLAASQYKNQEFIQGKVGMVEYVTYDFFKTVLGANSGNYEVAMMPQLKEDVPPYTGMGLWCYAVTSSSKAPDVAYDFLKFFCTSKEYQLTYCKPGYYIPSLIEAQEDNYYKTPDWEIILEQAKYAKATPGVNNWPAMDEAIYDAIQLALDGTKTPQAALDAAAEQIRALMK